MKFYNKNVTTDRWFSGITDWHDHHGETLNMPVKNDKDWMIGIELETIFPDDFDSEERDEWCDNCESNWFYMEMDGSLPDDTGCEFISTPLAPSDAKDPATWYPLIKALRDAHVRSYGSSSTGLHVHVSKSIFGDDPEERSNGIGRLIYLYYYVISKSLRERIFGRGSTEYAADLDKRRAPKTSAADVLKVALKYKEVRDEISKELTGVTADDRYYAINVQNSKTIEFRQGKGSVNNRRIAAICEFAEACCLYAKKYTDISKYSEDKFLATLKEDGPCKTFYMSDEL